MDRVGEQLLIVQCIWTIQAYLSNYLICPKFNRLLNLNDSEPTVEDICLGCPDLNRPNHLPRPETFNGFERLKPYLSRTSLSIIQNPGAQEQLQATLVRSDLLIAQFCKSIFSSLVLRVADPKWNKVQHDTERINNGFPNLVSIQPWSFIHEPTFRKNAESRSRAPRQRTP